MGKYFRRRLPLLLLLTVPTVVQAQDFIWTTNADGTLNLAAYIGTDSVVTIPSLINDLTVTSIGEGAFSPFIGNTGPASVTIPDTVTSIGGGAFDEDLSLTNVTIPDTITSIGESAFYYCLNLTSSITIPNGVTYIGPQTFYACLRLASVTLGTNLTSIGFEAFMGCGFTNITIPNSVTSIGDSAFEHCGSLTGVFFQGNAPTAGSSVFGSDDNVTVYYLPGITGWNPQVQTGDGSFGVLTNGFGFTITGSSGLSVVVEACTNLTNPTWSPMGTNTLTGGSSHFSDPQWTNYPVRFYRLSGLTFAGCPAVLWNPQPQNLGVLTDGFGFTITGTINIPVVVEACTNLASATWTSLKTCTLTNGSIYFSDPQWTNYPARLYRIRSP